MSKLGTKKEIIEVSVQNWDKLVIYTYKKPYSFQQQNGCQERGVFSMTIPSEINYDEDEFSDNIPFEINGSEMGVKFNTWLNTTEEMITKDNPESYPNANKLFWYRNFYPSIQSVGNDLYIKGLIDAGDYRINIDW